MLVHSVISFELDNCNRLNAVCVCLVPLSAFAAAPATARKGAVRRRFRHEIRERDPTRPNPAAALCPVPGGQFLRATVSSWPAPAAGPTYDRPGEGAAGAATIAPPRGDYRAESSVALGGANPRRENNRVGYPLNSTR